MGTVRAKGQNWPQGRAHDDINTRYQAQRAKQQRKTIQQITIIANAPNLQDNPTIQKMRRMMGLDRRKEETAKMPPQDRR